MVELKRRAAGWPYLASFIAVGLALSLAGPALTYLRQRAGVTRGDIGVLFSAQSLGYLVGAVLSGRLYDRGFGHRAIAGGLVGLAASALMIPHTASVSLLSVAFGFLGAFAGCVDVGGNTLVVWYSRGSGSSRLLNALHLFFGIGALLSPGLVNRSLAWSDGLGFASGLLALYALGVAVIIVLHETPRPAPIHVERDDCANDAQTPRRILLVIGMFFLIYVGVEVGFSGWIKTYAEGLNLPGRDAPTWLNTAFWVSFTLGRLIAVVLARRVRPGALLVASCTFTVALMVIMAATNGAPTAVWITTVLMGFAIAPQFATMIAYAEEHIALSGRATSYFVSAAGIGGLALPFLIGKLLDRSGSGAMPVTVAAAAAAATLWMLVVRRELRRARSA